MRGKSLVLVVAAAVSGGGRPAFAVDRVLRGAVTVAAPVEDVWDAWTTEDGVRSFFAPGAHVEPRVDGAYEIFFDPAAAPGERGADGMRILVFEPGRRLAFTWNAPTTQPVARAQRTVVTLDFADVGSGRTRLRLTHSGWGEGPDWDRAYEYFDHAWRGFVLPSLRRRFDEGPIDWTRPPDLVPVARTLKVDLRPARQPGPGCVGPR
jgi:uncharacterized protein YndB with AHSA1/START domain